MTGSPCRVFREEGVRVLEGGVVEMSEEEYVVVVVELKLKLRLN